MKKLKLGFCTFLFMLAALMPALAMADTASTCWKDSYGRGFALVPNCGPGEEMQAGLCYSPCKDGYKGVGVLCWQACPPGYQDIGVSCGKPQTGSRPTFLKEMLSHAGLVGGSRGLDCPNTWPRAYLNTGNGDMRVGSPKNPIPASEAPHADEMAVNVGKPFYDPIDSGTCWVCPDGWNRTGEHVKSEKACSVASERNTLCEAWSKANGGPGSCEQIGAFLYPRPPKGWSCTLNTCAADCPDGYRNDGLLCAKTQNYARPVSNIPKTCKSGYNYDAGLCYPGCKPGYSGVGPVCWGGCGGTMPFDCGAACAKDMASCALSTTENILSVMDVIITVSTTAASFGSVTAVKSALQKAIMQGAKKTIEKFAEKKLSKEAVKKMVLETAIETGVMLPEEQGTNIAGIILGEDFDYTTLDPTSISGVVKAYNKPLCSKASTPQANWTSLNGQASDIAVGADGTIWAIGTDTQPNGSTVYRLNAKSGAWERMPGAGVHLAVDGKGNAWVIDNKDGIYRWNGARFDRMPGSARDIAIGGDEVWVVGTQATGGGYWPNHWIASKNSWEAMNAGVTHLAVAGDGKRLAAVNDRNEIFIYDGKWTQLEGQAVDVAIGGPADSLFVLGTNKDDTGYGVHYWNGAQFTGYGGSLIAIAVKPDGKPVGVNTTRGIFESK